MSEFIKVAQPLVGQEEVEAVCEVLLSGQYVSGPRVELFEKEFAEYIGVSRAVAVNSGTAALHISLQALGVSEGDEVIVPPLTFFATVSSVLYVGALPVFADIDLDDLCLSTKDVERKITPRTKAIIAVHLFGAAAKMEALLKLSEERGIALLEDCAQAHGTEYDGKRVGSFGAAGAFSFFATKHMTTGEGGMITTNNPGLAESARMIRNHGMRGRDDHVVLGFNNRMTEMEAAMGIVQLNRLDKLNEKRIQNSEYLIQHIKTLPWARVPVPDKGVKHTYFWCPLMLDENRTHKSIEDLKHHLDKNGIGYRHRYREPLYRQPALRHLGLDYSRVSLQNVEKVAGKVIGLPNHPGLKMGELSRIVEALKSF